jgi:hypothetical protein
MGDRTAIAVIHPGWEGIPVGKHTLLTDMIKALLMKGHHLGIFVLYGIDHLS